METRQHVKLQGPTEKVQSTKENIGEQGQFLRPTRLIDNKVTVLFPALTGNFFEPTGFI